MSDTTLDKARGGHQAPTREIVRTDVIAFVADAATEAMVSECLTEMRAAKFEVKRMTCAQTRDYLSRNPTPRVLVVDIGGEERPKEMLAALADVVEPDVKVLVIGDQHEAHFYRYVTRELGASEYVYRPLSRAMVTRLFMPHIVGDHVVQQPARGARIITVVGARGGVGATTIMSNLAWYVAEETGRHTMVIDFDLHTGTSALLLGSSGNGGLKAGLESPERIDHLFVERSSQLVGKRLSLLSSILDLTDVPNYDEEGIANLFNVVSGRYNYVITELGDQPAAARRELSRQSHQQIIVMDATLPSIRDTLRLLSFPRSSNQNVRPLIVANNVGRPGTLSQQDMEKGLGRKPDIVIPYLPRLIGTAETDGVPAVKTRSTFRKAIKDLAQEALSVRSPDDQKAPVNGIFSKLKIFGR